MITQAEAPPRRRHRRLRVILASAMGLLLLGITLFGIGATRASWLDREHAQASLSSAVVPPPGTLTCNGGGTFVLGNTPPTVNFVWAAAATPANGLPVVDYYWTLVKDGVLVTSGTSNTTTRTAAITGTLVTAGTYTFKVVARSASGWVSTTGQTGTYAKSDAILGILLGLSACTVP